MRLSLACFGHYTKRMVKRQVRTVLKTNKVRGMASAGIPITRSTPSGDLPEGVLRASRLFDPFRISP